MDILKKKVKQIGSLPVLNMVRKRMKIEEVLLFFIFVLISIASVFLGNYAVTALRYERASKGFLSGHAKACYARLPEGGSYSYYTVVEDFVKGRSDVAVYFGSIRSIGHSEISVIFKGKPQQPDMISGRYFSEEDFTSGSNYAVLGKDFTPTISNSDSKKNCIKRIDGKQIYIKDYVEYEIIGIMGYSTESPINTSCLLTMNEQNTIMSNANPYILDMKNARATGVAFTDLKQALAVAGASISELNIPSGSSDVTQIFNMRLLNIIMLCFGVFSVLLATVPLTLYWAEKRRKSIAVKRLLGCKLTRILSGVCGRLIYLFHLGFLTGIGCFVVLLPLQLFTLSIFSQEMLAAYLGALLFNLMVTVVPVIKAFQVEPGDALRKGG